MPETVLIYDVLASVVYPLHFPSVALSFRILCYLRPISRFSIRIWFLFKQTSDAAIHALARFGRNKKKKNM